MRLLLISNSTNAGEPYLQHPKEQIRAARFADLFDFFLAPNRTRELMFQGQQTPARGGEFMGSRIFGSPVRPLLASSDLTTCQNSF